MANWVSRDISATAGSVVKVPIRTPSDPIYVVASAGTLTVNHTVDNGPALTAPTATNGFYTPVAGEAWGNILEVSSTVDSVITVLQLK